LYDQEFSKEVRERCLKIKKENENIMIGLFNLKENMMKVRGNTVEKDAGRES
jgi:hypothetical protein